MAITSKFTGSYIYISNFGVDSDRDAHNNLWTVEVGIKGKNQQITKWVKIADFDTFISFNGKHESQVVQNAIELGAFRSVNKIRKPNVCVVELGKGGLSEGIQLVLKNLIKYKESTDLLRVITPFGTISNVNLIGLNYSFKQGDCASMLVAQLQLQEVQNGIEVTEYTIEKTKNPENSNTENVGGKVCNAI